jgi:hypothetical protein
MGQVYVLKLRGGKWYVGYTERGITRVLEHLENKGKFKAAKWTQKHRPVSWQKAVAEITPDDHSEKDEDRITLALMAEHGIHNVRGGKWCMMNMKSQVVKDLEKRIGKPKGGVKCGRCGRIGHNRTRCYASKTVDGVTITTKSWKFQPKAKAKPKPKPKKAKPKPKPKKAKDKNVICARCNRVGHESKDCYASSKVAGTGVLADMLRRGLPKR